MNAGAAKTALREIGAILRQTADLRRLCLSLREAKNQEREADLAADFERFAREPAGRVAVSPEMVRVGLRNLWRQREYARIVTVTGRLPPELVEGDETILMYFTCASRRLTTGGAAGRVGR